MIDTASGKTGLAPAVRPAWYVDHITEDDDGSNDDDCNDDDGDSCDGAGSDDDGDDDEIYVNIAIVSTCNFQNGARN